MSAIHEALKKAQEERDNTPDSYQSVGQSGERRKAPVPGAAKLAAVAGAVILLAGAGYFWFNMAGKKDLSHKAEAIGTPSPVKFPIAVKVAEPPPAPAGQAGEVSPQPPAQGGPPGGIRAGMPDIKNARLFFDQAVKHHQSGRTGLAVEFYQKSLQYDQNFAKSLNNLAVIAMEEGRLGAAKEGFQKAQRADPHYADPYYNLACLSAREGSPAKALPYLREAFAKDPETRAAANSDPDLAPVRQLPGFAQLMKETEQKPPGPSKGK
ncbi:MAG: hypothetical protein HZB23_14435 [Deltaproteobacteria bacterium]|nr:hypothetical protein [Deltaproteobacteria bacterium]